MDDALHLRIQPLSKLLYDPSDRTVEGQPPEERERGRGKKKEEATHTGVRDKQIENGVS